MLGRVSDALIRLLGVGGSTSRIKLADGHPVACGLRWPKALKGDVLREAPHRETSSAVIASYWSGTLTTRRRTTAGCLFSGTALARSGVKMCTGVRHTLKHLSPHMNLYSGRVCPSGSIDLGAVDLTAGRHALQFTSVGKDPVSANEWFGVDAVELAAE
jgi:hypothetical protein